MKRFVFLLFAFFLSFSFFATAQSLDSALNQLETVRLKNGEQSKEYLSALDTVILKANIAGQTQMAFDYRKKHLDIVKQMKSNESVEVADDLWRLGNTSRMLGDTILGLKYYTQAAEVFEKSIDIKKNYDYIEHYDFCLYNILQILVSEKDQEGVSYYSTRFIKLSEETNGVNSCSHLEHLIAAWQFNNLVGNIDNALNYCLLVTKNCINIDSCNFYYVHVAYEFVESYYFNLNQNDKQIAMAKDHLNKLDSANVPLYKEITETLYFLLGTENSIDDAILYGKRAEKMLLDKYSSKEELYSDQMYYEIVELLAVKHLINADYISGMSYFQIVCDVIEHNKMIDSKEYYDALKYLVYCAILAGEYAFVIETAPKLESMIFRYSDSPIEDAYFYVVCLGDANSKSGNYNEALYYYDDALEILPQLLSGESLFESQVQLLVAKAEVLNMAGKKQEAIVLISEGKEKLKLLDESTNTMYLKAHIFSIEGQLVSDFQDAMMCFDTALLLIQRLLTDAQLEMENNSYFHALKYQQAIILLNKGMIQFYNGVATDAINAFTASASIIQEMHSQNSTEYIACQNNIALCKMNLGNYSDAIITLDGIMEIVKNNYGIENYYYASCLQNYALYYQCIGQPDKALQYCMEAAILIKTIFGEESEKYGQIVALIGDIYLANQMPNEALHYLSEGLSIIDKNGGTSSYAYCHILPSLAIASLELEHIDEGVNYFYKAEAMIDSIYGPLSSEHAQLASSIGWELSNYDEIAKEFCYDIFIDAVRIYLLIGQTYRPEYIQSLIGYSVSGLCYDKPIADDFIEIATKAVASYYEKNVAYYSSTDREFVWEILSNIKNTIVSTRTDDKADIFIYNYLLFSKSLVLSTSDGFKNAVFNTGQQDLINQYNDILTLQRSIDMQSFGIQNENQSYELLYERKTSMERQLMAEMRALGYSANDSITYYYVRRLLKHDEIAIEFVDYYHLKEEKTYYVALLAKSSWGNPIYVQLCTEDELKNCIGNPNVTYTTDDLYRLLWQPLAEYINEGDKVYFSPSGMLHTIALESLHTPDGSCLNDKYNLVRMTSTRELCKERQPKTYETGAVYGGLQYDVDQQRMTEVAAMNKAASEESPVFALRGEDRGNWNYLKGTKDEAEHIASIMRQANIGCELYEGDLGNEESFKALSGSNTDIIHLATHGYFIEGEKADMNDFMRSLSPLARQKTDSIIDPLLRSGLILSGGNRAWLGQEVPEGIEDGVLTALEISTMNLSGTDMVIMSACETGLGDITSDGVFGLQRAFKMAGVQTLVMSLWKVDDNATSLMKQTFYEHLLSGMSKREAFNLAQAAVKAKYPEPYYWAGFVMLD